MGIEKTKPKKKSWLKWGIVLLFFLAVSLTASGKYWGVYGRIGTFHSTIILHSLLPSQKAEVADALNHHYTNTTLRKYTKGLVLNCEPTVEGIKEQFNWFYRDAITAQFTESPGYHTLIEYALYELNGGAVIPISEPSTFELERALIEFSKHDEDPDYTDKDMRSDFLSTLGLAVKYTIGAALPELSLSISVVGLVHDMMPAPEKLVQLIHIFHAIRLRNWLYTTATLWTLCMLVYMLKRRKVSNNS